MMQDREGKDHELNALGHGFSAETKEWLMGLFRKVEEKVSAKLDEVSEEWSQETQDRLASAVQHLEKRLEHVQGSSPLATRPLVQEDRHTEALHLNDYGVQLFYRSQWEQAAQMLEEATRINPALVEAWNNLAVVYSALSQSERAVQAFQKAAELDENRVAYLNNQAVLALLDTKPEKALEILENVAHHNQVPVLLNLAQAYLALGHHDQAIQMWRNVLAIDPDQDEARQHLRQYFQ